jgi:hypothetical protein
MTQEAGRPVQPPAVPSGSTPLSPKEIGEIVAATRVTGIGAETVTTTEMVPVALADVIKYAKKNCKTCFGKGAFKVSRVADRNGQPQTTFDTCGCAVRQFFKHNPNVVQDKATNTWYWPASQVTPVDDVTPKIGE